MRFSIHPHSKPPRRVVTKLPVIKQNTTKAATPSKSAVNGVQSNLLIKILAMGEVNSAATPYTHLNTTVKMANGSNTTKPPTKDFLKKLPGLKPSCVINDAPALLHIQWPLLHTLGAL